MCPYSGANWKVFRTTRSLENAKFIASHLKNIKGKLARVISVIETPIFEP
jgi:hypothetical protein